MKYKTRIIQTVVMWMLLVAVVPAQASNPKALVDDWNEALAEIRQELDQQEWKKARRGADKLLDNMSAKIRTGEGAWNLYARVLMHRALARAGASDMDEAEWDWHMAATFDDEVAWADLAEFELAGDRLEAYRREFKGETAGWGPSDPDKAKIIDPTVTPPKKRRSPRPNFPWATRGLKSQTVVQAIIDVDGRLKMPRLFELQQPTQAYAALETVRRWRFKPATQDGKPVSVYYNLTVNF